LRPDAGSINAIYTNARDRIFEVAGMIHCVMNVIQLTQLTVCDHLHSDRYNLSAAECMNHAAPPTECSPVY